MTGRDTEAWWQTLLKAALEIWSTHATLSVLDRGNSGELAWWDRVRRLAAALAYRMGRVAIYAENRYNAARA